MEVDTMLQGEEEEEEEWDEGGNSEISYSLFFMEPNNEEIRDMEDQEVRDYWEAGVTSECLSALKSGDIDHSWVQCYHCNLRGHIKANYSGRKSASIRPWKGRAGPNQEKDGAPARMGERNGRATSPGRPQAEWRVRKRGVLGLYNLYKRIFSKGRHGKVPITVAGPRKASRYCSECVVPRRDGSIYQCLKGCQGG